MIICILKDITQTTLIQNKLNESEQMYKKLMDVLNEGVIIHDNKNIKYINDKGLDILELDFDEKLNSIKGSNGTGKTTVKEAYLWVLGNEYTNIIPSENNREIPNLKISVEIKLNCGDYSYSLCRVQQETYKTNKETNEKEKKGNESYYYYVTMYVLCT